MGRISTRLLHFQQVSYDHHASRRTGSNWGSKLINQLWLVMWKMWDHRNHINNSTITAQQRRDRGELLTQVRQQFAQGKTTLLKQDYYLLKHKDKVLHYPLRDLEDWLARIGNARRAHKRHVVWESRAIQASQRCMREWRLGLRGPRMHTGPAEPDP